MAYATIADIKPRIDKTLSDDDPVLVALLDAASEAIDGLCNRPDGFLAITTATARYYAGKGKPYILIDECVAITEVAVKESVTDTSYTAWDTPTTNLAGDGDWIAFRGDPVAPDFNNTPYTGLMIDSNGDYAVFTTGKYTTRGGFRPLSDIPRGLPTVRVTSRWGYATTVPPQVREATVVLASRWHARGESRWSDALASGELGQLLYRQSIDPDVKAMLIEARLVRPAIGTR